MASKETSKAGRKLPPSPLSSNSPKSPLEGGTFSQDSGANTPVVPELSSELRNGQETDATKGGKVLDLEMRAEGRLAKGLSEMLLGALDLKTRESNAAAEASNKVKDALANEVDDSDKPTISVPKILPEEWLHLFETTGLCQAYDLDSERPTPAGTPLFVVQYYPGAPALEDEDGKVVKIPDKPAFIVDDQIRTTEEETFTERRRYLVESGFSAADLSISVPYVKAAIQADKSEKEQSEQDRKTVFITTREEYPRCQINIAASVLSGYLAVNPEFVKRVKLVSMADIEEYRKNVAKVALLKNAIAELWAEKPLDYFARKYGKLIQEWRNLFSKLLSAEDDQEEEEEGRQGEVEQENAKAVQMTGASREIEEEEDEKEGHLVRRPRKRVHEQAGSSSLKVPDAIMRESSRISAPAQAEPGVQSSAALAEVGPQLGKVEGSAATKPDSFSPGIRSAQKGSDADATVQKRRGPPQSTGDSSGVEGLVQGGNGTGTDEEGEEARQPGEAEEEKGRNNVQTTGTSIEIKVDKDVDKEGLVQRPRERVAEQAGPSSVMVRDANVAIGKESSAVTQGKASLPSLAAPAEKGPAHAKIGGSNPNALSHGMGAPQDSGSKRVESGTLGPTDDGASPSGGSKEGRYMDDGSVGGGTEDKVAREEVCTETGAPPKTRFQKVVSRVLRSLSLQKSEQQQTDKPSIEREAYIAEQRRLKDLDEEAEGEGGGDGEAADEEENPPTPWEAYTFLLEATDLLRKEVDALKPARETIVVSMQELIVQFGAVWTERITLGGLHLSTNEEEETLNLLSLEKTRSVKVSLGGHYAGGEVGVQASKGKTSMAGSDESKNTRSKAFNATGGDTITFREKDHTDWVQSIRPIRNWRIISYRNLRVLTEIPGLDSETKELLQARLEVVEDDVREIEDRKDPPRRSIGHLLKQDMKGYWYGFDCVLQSNLFNPGPSILQLRINQTIEFNVNNNQAKGVRFHGFGQDNVGESFYLEGYVLEVVDFDPYDRRPYQALGTVRMVRSYSEPTKKKTYTYSGHLDRTGMHGVWQRTGDNKSGTWTLAPVKFMPIDFIDENWTFAEREANFNEPQRRWLLPPAPPGKPSSSLTKRIDVDLIKGPWQGYKVLRGISDESQEITASRRVRRRRRERDVSICNLNKPFDGYSESPLQAKVVVIDKGVPFQTADGAEEDPKETPQAESGLTIEDDVLSTIEDDSLIHTVPDVQLDSSVLGRTLLPVYMELNIHQCVLVGGQAGRQRYNVTGSAREGNTRYNFRGYIQQVTTPNKYVICPHDYPFLGKVDFCLTRLGGTKFYKGHLDHLGMHGFILDGKDFNDDILAMARYTATFALMPVAKEARKTVTCWSSFTKGPAL